ncbi:MAG: WYL domain-containing protein [Candidatus Delongbacteria bacterium]|jgi:predicted DNA-binding transcriptional regulator YafY|nr:WYL domain-containing protein [Candidatus Delongbacteria bacterium]
MVEKKTIQRFILALSKLNTMGELHMNKFCDEANISSRTFKRLIQDLREIMDLPIVYDIKKNVYTIDRSAVLSRADEDILETFDKLNTNNEMLFFYSFVKSLIECEYFFPPMNPKEKGKKVSDYKDILRVLEKFVPEQDRNISDHIEYHISNHYKLNMKIKFKNMIENIITSLKTKKLLTYKYKGLRTIAEPLKIVHYHGKWYLMVYLVNKNKAGDTGVIRTYNLSHIENMTITKDGFRKHKEKDTEIKNSFGIFMDDDIKTAVIRFYSDSVIRAVEETVWSENQKSKKGEDQKKGKYFEYTIEYPASGSVEVISRVLGFGQFAEIISPDELRDNWVEKIKAMSELITHNF